MNNGGTCIVESRKKICMRSCELWSGFVKSLGQIHKEINILKYFVSLFKQVIYHRISSTFTVIIVIIQMEKLLNMCFFGHTHSKISVIKNQNRSRYYRQNLTANIENKSRLDIGGSQIASSH